MDNCKYCGIILFCENQYVLPINGDIISYITNRYCDIKHFLLTSLKEHSIVGKVTIMPSMNINLPNNYDSTVCGINHKYLQFFNQLCIGRFQLVTTSTRDLGSSTYKGLVTVTPLQFQMDRLVHSQFIQIIMK